MYGAGAHNLVLLLLKCISAISLCMLCSCTGSDPQTTQSLAVGEESIAAGSQSIPQSELFPAQRTDSPDLTQLEARLERELEVLGIDGERSMSIAPSGEENAVFDLEVSYFDLRQGAVLHWTERHVGDYDMNGVVNAADLAPIAQRWKYKIDYRSPEDSAVSWWPMGNPRDGGLSGVLNGVPGFNTPADQWRSARVDGDGNGEINLGDVTAIARHWQQRIDSYRVYRRAPGELEFSLLASVQDPGYSILRSSQFPANGNGPNGNWTYRLLFADLEIGPGSYEYYVASYDSSSETEGPASVIASIEFMENPDTPEPEIPGNQSPKPSLFVSPRQGDLPLEVHFDASGSIDPDGEIVLYLWDWEGDGQVDESSDNEPLATYVYTEPGYYKPRLTLRDDLGASTTIHANIDLEVSDSGWLPPRIMNLGADMDAGHSPLKVSFLPELVVPSGMADLKFEWDFDSDGVIDSIEPAVDDGKEATYDRVDHVFENAGDHLVHLRVVDNKGLSGEFSGLISVSPNTDPIAVLTANSTEGQHCMLVTFSTTGTTDPDGDKTVSYFRPDSAAPYFKVDKTFQHYYNSPGEHVAGLLVEDDHGGSSAAELTIDISGPADVPPVAVLNAST